jgi:hypothetical protein
MNSGKGSQWVPVTRGAVLVVWVLFSASTASLAQGPAPPGTGSSDQGSGHNPVCEPSILGSPYIPVDHWIYPAMWRLYAMGYVDNVFLGLRPWTRSSVDRMLEEAGGRIDDAESNGSSTAEEARSIYTAINDELHPDVEGPCRTARGATRLESVYSATRAISGTPLEDSYHLGSTIVNDYGRPFENGFNNYSGLSGYATAGRFAVYVRGEFQGAPSAAGYSPALAQTLSELVDEIPYADTAGVPYNQPTIPRGPIPTATQGRLLEAYVSAQVLNHVLSFGKQDQWLGPAQGASFAYSNNAQNIYAFEINRIEPLYVPLLSRLTGSFRYEFLIGELQGHTLIKDPAYEAHPSSATENVANPGNPWVHLEKINFKPTANLELGFERTAMFGGEGHSPVTLHTFLKSFFSLSAPQANVKYTRADPGARFGSFDFSYRLPFVRNWLTLYADGEVHDDVSPIDAPRRAAWRPGLDLSHVPGLPKLEIRAEAATTDPPVATPSGAGWAGRFMYYEGIEKQGYTNQGQIFGDWIGREDKGGQGWITWHLSGNEWIALGVRNQKAAKDFIPATTGPTFVDGGTTLDDVNVQVVKRLTKQLELNAYFEDEHWKAPVYLPGRQNVTVTQFQLTWWPARKIAF